MIFFRPLLLAALLFHLLLPGSGLAQVNILSGLTTGPDQLPVSGINIRLKNSKKGTYSDNNGRFKLTIDADEEPVLIFSGLNYETAEVTIPSNSFTQIIQVMKPSSIHLNEVEVTQERRANPGSVNIDPLLTKNLAGTAGGAIEQLVKTLPGVSSHNELSSQYSVRGGNYDENLLYVNGIEIYRPFLVKTGEQEGLSFLNPDLTDRIQFSPGGFESSYGDKMSSVLDIRYKTPVQSKGTASVEALGASAHFEGRILKNKFSYLAGIRYRDNRYLLGTLDQKGHYDPAFYDLQTLLNYDFTPRFSLEFLGNLSGSEYTFTPETRETRFGTLSQSYLLKIYFEGKEKDRFANHFGALTAHFKPSEKTDLKLTASSFYSDEKERYDILGQYYLNEVLPGNGQNENPDSTLLLGVGSSLLHAGNFLQASIFNLEHRGSHEGKVHHLKWGLKYQSEKIHDLTGEWEMRDSAGYSLPIHSGQLELYRSLKSDNQLESKRFSAFLQDNFSLRFRTSTLSFNVGGRLQYWDYNRQTIFSPRISLDYLPGKLNALKLHATWGVYQQMPFFKELKNREAEFVTSVRAQKSIQTLLGIEYPFLWEERPFKFTAEIWHKSLTHLIPYKVTNLDLQYFPEQQAKGYATGFEMKISGEPVPGATSWASLTLMKTEEDILGDHYTKTTTSQSPETAYPGYLPRPTDQRFNFSLFFQDYLPKNPGLKMNLTLLYGSRLPFGPPFSERWMDTFRMPSYKRVDLGFSKLLKGRQEKSRTNFLAKSLTEAWLSFEIFNLFDLDNTISYYWVSDFQNQMHAVPNYLTGRRLNLKLAVEF